MTGQNCSLGTRLREDHRRARRLRPVALSPDCPTDEALAERVVARGVAGQGTVLTGHVAGCPRCATRFRQLLALHREAQDLDLRAEVVRLGQLVFFPGAEPVTPASQPTARRLTTAIPRRRKSSRGWRRGASLVAAVMLLVVLGGLEWDRQTPPGVASEVLRSEWNETVVPSSGVVLDAAPTIFQWSPQPGANRYRLRLHGADGARVHLAGWGSAESSSYPVPRAVTDTLAPGSYYWVVEVEGEVQRPRLGPYVFHLGTDPRPSASPPPRSATALEGPGVPVIEVATGSSTYEAGLRPGDRLLGWRRADSREPRFEPLGDPFAVLRLLREEALRGAVTLVVARTESDEPMEIDGRLEITVPAGRWRLEVGAVGEGATTYDDAWQALTEAQTWRRQRRLEEAVDRLEAVLDRSLPPDVAYALAAELGEAHFAAERFDAARTAYLRAARLGGVLGERGGRPSLTLARHHTDLGVVAQAVGDLELAEEEHHRALELRRRLAPGSIEVAVSLNNLGAVAHYRGDSGRSEALWLEAAELFEASPGHVLAGARLLVNLGGAAFSRGDLDLAAERWRRAHRVRQRLRPESLDLAATHNNLALLAAERGQLEVAEGHHRQSLELRRRLAPDSLAVARSLHNLSAVALLRGDLWRATDLETEAAALRRRLAPDHLETAQSLLTLGRLALARSRVDEAREPVSEGLAILARAQPEGGLDTALGLQLRGRLEARDGHHGAARRDYEAALAQLREHAPDSLFEAAVLRDRARLELERGDSEAVGSAQRVVLQSRLERAESIARRLAPDSADLADTLGLRAAFARRTGDLPEARRLGLDALAVLDRQEALWGGRELDRLRFDGLFADLYLAAARDSEAVGPAAVFEIVEHYRARRIRTLLATSSTQLRGAASERQVLAWRYEAARQRLASLEQAGDDEAAARLRSRLRDLGARREALARSRPAGAVTSAGIVASVGASDLAATLPPGTAWVSFLVGEDATLVVAVGPSIGSNTVPTPTGIHWVDLGREALLRRVADFRELVESPQLGSQGLDTLGRQGAELYDLLLGPLGEWLDGAKRLVLVPDGPLDDLPWAALVVDGDEDTPRFLVERQAISVALSATVERSLAERVSATSGPWAVVAEVEGEGPRLVASRREARTIAHRVPGARVYLGAAGTESALRSAADAQVLHLAVHGVLDARHPFDSYLALAPEGVSASGAEGPDASGRLYAWEVMEELDLVADLVTLSSCEGRGRPGAGSGPLGLVTAFHLAGARSVVASHWRVADSSTAELMTHFVDALVAGRAKDEALHLAQRTVLANSDTRHPFHWAAFQLSGDGSSSLATRPLLVDSEVER